MEINGNNLSYDRYPIWQASPRTPEARHQPMQRQRGFMQPDLEDGSRRTIDDSLKGECEVTPKHSRTNPPVYNTLVYALNAHLL